MGTSSKRPHFEKFAALWALAVFAGVMSGAVLNALNGWISPPYFAWFFYYPGGAPSWTPLELFLNIVRHGAMEGLCFGVFMATLFSGYVLLASRATCPLSFSVRYIPKMVALIAGFWAIGGLNGIIIYNLLVHHKTDFTTFITMVGNSPTDNLRYVWVAGAIWGVYIGSMMTLVWGCARFNLDWREHKKREAAD
jgi:hypothetical protein